MSWYPDLGNDSDIATGPHVRAIGWLSADYSFPLGDPPDGFLNRLTEFCRRWGDCVEAMNWAIAVGVHECEFCGSNLAAGNVGVPAADVLYVAPEMVAHYVAVHRYAPPAEFVAAVMAADLPGTAAYAAAVERFRDDG